MVNPIQLQSYLKGTNYPASKQDIVGQAQANGADDDTVAALREIDDGPYDSPAAVNHALAEAGQT